LAKPAVAAHDKGNIGKRREAMNGGHAAGRRATGGCWDANPDQTPRLHDTSRIAWAELVEIHDDCDVFQASPNELPAFDIHSL